MKFIKADVFAKRLGLEALPPKGYGVEWSRNFGKGLNSVLNLEMLQTENKIKFIYKDCMVFYAKIEAGDICFEDEVIGCFETFELEIPVLSVQLPFYEA